mmetsp:Transcript_9203/g.15473  ORF Transcript_9203/g.15473 Transcript_9203/m.15473 type:complete len:366 (+) Transcript_9203:38-1135(+)
MSILCVIGERRSLLVEPGEEVELDDLAGLVGGDQVLAVVGDVDVGDAAERDAALALEELVRGELGDAVDEDLALLGADDGEERVLGDALLLDGRRLVQRELAEVDHVHAGGEHGEANALYDLRAGVVADEDVLEGVHVREVLVAQLGARRELGHAGRVLLAGVEVLELVAVVLGDLLKAVGVLEDVEAVHEVVLLVSHLGDVVVDGLVGRLLLGGLLQLQDFHELLVAHRALPKLDLAVVEGDEDGADGVGVREGDVGDARELVHEVVGRVHAVDVNALVVVHDVRIELEEGLGLVVVVEGVALAHVFDPAVVGLHAISSESLQTCNEKCALVGPEDEVHAIVTVGSGGEPLRRVHGDLENVLDC